MSKQNSIYAPEDYFKWYKAIYRVAPEDDEYVQLPLGLEDELEQYRWNEEKKVYEKDRKCECGVKFTGGIHSDYCPRAGESD